MDGRPNSRNKAAFLDSSGLNGLNSVFKFLQRNVDRTSGVVNYKDVTKYSCHLIDDFCVLTFLQVITYT